MKTIEMGYSPSVLLNVMNETGLRSRSHGLPASILRQQAEAMKLPIHLLESSWNDYEKKFVSGLIHLRNQFACKYVVFGDIDLQEHRDWEEKVTAAAGLTAILPLWKQDRKQLLMQMLDAGIETMIVSCNNTLGPDFLGRILSKEIITEFEERGVDPCGENGEYHTVVLNCPLFEGRINYSIEGREENQQYHFLTLSC